MKNILVPTDFSESANAALAQAVKLAGVTGGRITLVHVIFVEKIKEELLGLDSFENLVRVLDLPPDAARYTPSNPVEPLRAAAEDRLKGAAAAVSSPAAITIAVVEGRPSTAIVEYAGKNGVDLIVMGTEGRSGLGRAFLGSVADNVIRQAKCPVMVVRA
jgi:nucleotide-binding universal stress UspA family protein